MGSERVLSVPGEGQKCGCGGYQTFCEWGWEWVALMPGTILILDNPVMRFHLSLDCLIFQYLDILILTVRGKW